MPPDLLNHLQQAEHNRDCALFLLHQNNKWDWAITAAFYAALHFTNAAFLSENKPVPEKVDDNQTRHTLHATHVKNVFGNNCYRIYRKLMDASNDVRYIRDYSDSQNIPSLTYYSKKDAENLVNNQLQVLFTEVDNSASIDLKF